MSKMMNLQRLAEVRHNLSRILSLSTLVDIDVLVDDVKTVLGELGVLREAVFSTETIIEVAPEPEPVVIQVTKVQVRTPKPSDLPPMPGPSRRVPASTCYNIERYVPYRVLWVKVIIRASYDYALWRESKDLRLRKFAQDAERWLFEPSDLSLSFENICASFDFPIELIRRKTRALTKDDVKKLEFRERQGRTEMVGEILGGNDE